MREHKKLRQVIPKTESKSAQSKGTIKIHVLTTWARTQVRNTRIVSVLEFCASVFMFFYCFAFGGYRAWEFNQQLSS